MSAPAAPSAARGERRVIEGSHAIPYAVQLARPGVIAACPGTLSYGVVETLSEMCGDGRLGARFVAVESERSALDACAGASQAGVRAFTAVSSQGLAAMHETLHWCAAARLPIVMVSVDAAPGPLNALPDQNASLLPRDAGWLQYYCESPQEAYDTILQAFRVAEHVLLPAMVCVEASPSGTSEPVTPATLEAIDEFLPPFVPPCALVPGSPRGFGGPVHADASMELRAQVQSSMLEAERFADVTARDYASRLGRHHPTVTAEPDEPCDVVVLTMGSTAGTARAVVSERRARGEAVGLVKLHLFRPFPAARLREVLGRTRKVAVVDRNVSLGCGGVLAAEVRAALCNRAGAPEVFSFIAGLSGRDVTTEVIDDILSYTTDRERPEEDALWVGLKE